MAKDINNKPVFSIGHFNLKQWHIIGIIAAVISLSVFIISIVLFNQLSIFVEFNIRQVIKIFFYFLLNLMINFLKL